MLLCLPITDYRRPDPYQLQAANERALLGPPSYLSPRIAGRLKRGECRRCH